MQTNNIVPSHTSMVNYHLAFKAYEEGKHVKRLGWSSNEKLEGVEFAGSIRPTRTSRVNGKVKKQLIITDIDKDATDWMIT